MEQGRSAVAGRVVVVTGAGGGFGRVLAHTLVVAGAHVVAVDRDVVALKNLSEEPAPGPGGLTTCRADVRDDDDLDGVMRVARDLGGPHIVVNNAGGWTPGDRQYPEATVEEWSSTLALDLRAPMRLTQLVLGAGDAGPGRVVVSVSSSGALGPSPYGSPEYAAAKAALIRLTSALSDSESRYGARVLCVVPGWIGLERALGQWAALSEHERATLPALVPAQLLAETVLRMIEDTTMVSGTVVHLPGGDQVTIQPP